MPEDLTPSEKAKAEINRLAEEHRAKTEAERPLTYTERLQDMGRLPKPSGGGGGTGGGGAADMPPGFMPGKKGGKGPIDYKKGGSVSKRADGCALKGKTRGKML